jgi:hypothetical protein
MLRIDLSSIHVGHFGDHASTEARKGVAVPIGGAPGFSVSPGSDVQLSTADLCSRLGLLRWQLHGINAELRKTSPNRDL